ncbi:MAG TPA: hypothetical protein VFE25_03165, partial [Opitutaceae bacterium]|nr:hypothetical protein [Opitutaceae bacterium]
VFLALGVSPKRWVYLALGGLPGAAVFLAHASAAYGSPFITGYGNAAENFSSALIPGTLLHYARWLPALFTPFAVLVFGTPFLSGDGRRGGLLLASWVAIFTLFYSFYEYTHETWWYLRFLLPAAPALVVGSALVLRALLGRSRLGRDLAASPVAFAVALGLVAGNSIWWSSSLGAMRGGAEEERYWSITSWMRVNLPSDAVCLAMQASGSIYFYTSFPILRWDMMDPASAAKVRVAADAANRPLYAALFPFEIDRIQEIEKALHGTWKPIETIGDITVFERIVTLQDKASGK